MTRPNPDRLPAAATRGVSSGRATPGVLEPFYLEGDASYDEPVVREDKPDWDLSVVAGPRGAVLFAPDLAHLPDSSELP